MTLQPRDKRAMGILASALVLGGIYWLATRTPSTAATVAAPVEGIERSERRLATLQKALATVDGKEALLKQVSAELADREKALIPGDTANQAQAQILQIVRRVAKDQNPPIEVRQFELGQPRPYGDAYGLVSVTVTIDARTDEVINLLAALSQQPEAISTEDLRFAAANPKSKVMMMRITVSGLVPRKLVPEKKGFSF